MLNLQECKIKQLEVIKNDDLTGAMSNIELMKSSGGDRLELRTCNMGCPGKEVGINRFLHLDQ